MNGCRGIKNLAVRVVDMHLNHISLRPVRGVLVVIQQGLPKDHQGHLTVISLTPRAILLWVEYSKRILCEKNSRKYKRSINT